MPGVLFVCTANHCRSPIAEALLRESLAARGLAWPVGSAGVDAVPGMPMHRFAARILDARGLSANGWMSRRINRDMVESADLVLTATRAHRGAVVAMVPAAVRNTFVLGQFARLADLAEPEVKVRSVAELIDLVTAARRHAQPAPSSADEIPDPIGKPLPTFEECAERIETAIDAIAARLLA